ncbi:MAG: hypothetical protein ACREON_15985 [Gemmatimonadaceae bacterium]
MTLTRPGFRRLFALVVLLGFGFFTAESLIADVCDGDSGIAIVSIADAETPDSGPVPMPGHTMHVCHCVHTHGGLPAWVDRVFSAPHAVSAVVTLVTLTPPSPALELQLRPPIA